MFSMTMNKIFDISKRYICLIPLKLNINKQNRQTRAVRVFIKYAPYFKLSDRFNFFLIGYYFFFVSVSITSMS